MKKVYLPPWMESHALLYAECLVEEVKGLKRGDKGYDAAVKKAANDFLLEAYEESLTPHLARNPSTKIAADAFAVFNDELFSAKGSFLDTKAGGVGSSRYDEFARQLKAAVTHIAHIYLTLEMGMRLKQKSGGSTTVEFTTDMPASEQIEAVKARYYRAAAMILVLSGVERLFDMPGEQLKAMVDSRIKSRTLPELKDDDLRFDTMFEIKEEIEKKL